MAVRSGFRLRRQCGDAGSGRRDQSERDGDDRRKQCDRPEQCGKSETGHNYFDMEFHRGGRDARPENTLYAYQYALENGALTIECDMQLTADGQTFFRIIRR